MKRSSTRAAASVLLASTLAACAQTPPAAAAPPPDSVRICDDSGCSWRPRQSATFNPLADVDLVQEQCLAALIEMARADPRAAHDLALRDCRGDGVAQKIATRPSSGCTAPPNAATCAPSWRPAGST